MDNQEQRDVIFQLICDDEGLRGRARYGLK